CAYRCYRRRRYDSKMAGRRAAQSWRSEGRRNTVSAEGKPAFLVTAADLAPEALALLGDYEIVYAGRTPSEQDIVDLCARHNPVAIIVRYSKVGAAAMDAAPALRVISKHRSEEHTSELQSREN